MIGISLELIAMQKPVYSIIAPIFNESGNIQELFKRISTVMDSTEEPWELILIDDGSTDDSAELIRNFASQDSRVRPIIFARNFGHQLAVTAGLDFSRGDAVVIIDSDLQDPPEVILDLITKWKEGYQVVYAVRAEREGESWFKLFTASFFLSFDLQHHRCENPPGRWRFSIVGPQGG